MADKIIFTNSSLDDTYIGMSEDEIVAIHERMMNTYRKYLYGYKVRSPRKELFDYSRPPKELIAEMTAKDLWLVLLFKYPKTLIAKDMFAAFIKRFKPASSGDQQVRHLKEDGWDLLTWRCPFIDDDGTECVVPAGFYYLQSLNKPSAKFLSNYMRTQALSGLSSSDFSMIKQAYGFKCAVCGIMEHTPDPRKGFAKVTLQKGHLDPKKGADVDNIVPMCGYCNQYYKDNFVFNKYGRVYAINEPNIILRSSDDVQLEVYNILKDKVDSGKL